MSTLQRKIGFWSSVLLTISFLAWIICFVAIALTSPLFFWTNLNDYLEYAKTNSQVFQNIAKTFMLLFGPAYLVFISSFYGYVVDETKILQRISFIFASLFAVLSSIHYFVQLTTVRLSIASGQTAGLEHLVQANPISVISSINMLGWTLFLGLSSLFIAPIFKNFKILKYAFTLNGICCFLAGIGYVFQIDWLTFIFINLGVGGAMLTISITSIFFYRKEMKK